MVRLLFKMDWLILAPALLLVALSLLMIFSTSVTQSGTDWTFFQRQLAYSLFGLLVFFFLSLSDYRVLMRFSFIFYILLILLLVVTYLIGIETRGSVRWLDFGFVTLQASEIAKPVLILLFSYFFVIFSPQKIKNFLFSALLLALPLGMVFYQPDFGSAIVLGSIWFAIVYLAGTNLFLILFTLVTPFLSLPLAWNFLRDYQRARIETFLNPTIDPLGEGYNVIQAIIAVGSGQLTGQGLGRGTQSHLNFLPEQKTDFIFATTAEELGFLGVCVLLALFAFLLFRLFLALNNSRDRRGSLLVIGVITTFLVQIFINVGMNLGILPITGITLPLVSFGGSSLVAMFAMLGLVESVVVVSKQDS